ncbi:MAG: GGDEF domain-containing protein [Candidatus Dactylopiibacterium carminicum]|nr:MAG: GGDEF domain-containing protein [Candidatus Dactylopiibacterium carminicum]
MAETTPSPPSAIARETLRQLAIRRIQPTPENFREVYHEIAGSQPEDNFPERSLRQIAAALPRITPAQLRLARQFEAACSERHWQGFRQQLLSLFAEQAGEELAWGTLVRELTSQLERQHHGLGRFAKQEALQRVLDGSSNDNRLLFSRLQGLARGWGTQPSVPGSASDNGASAPAAQSELSQWRKVLAEILENAIGMLLVDAPELAAEASALARLLKGDGPEDPEAFSIRLRQFAYKLQWVAQDQGYIRQALLNLLQLIVENISEIVLEDQYLHGQMSVLGELFSRPLDKPLLEELGERLRDVIYKQGTLKRSLADAQQRLRDMLASFVGQLGEFAESTGTYHGKVSAFAEKIAQAKNLHELAGLVDDIARETRNVEYSARRSHQELLDLRTAVDQANREINRLETELEEASELVRHDPLTGTLNRKGLDEILARESARMQRRNSRLCLAMLDVDDFKKLNDSFGHTTGDDALRHLATVIRDNIRPQDSAGRFGGEEFLVLLPDTGQDEAAIAIQRLQRELTRRIFMRDNQRLLITFSAGVTEVRAGEEIQQAVIRADQAMYRAKRAGKNRVESG